MQHSADTEAAIERDLDRFNLTPAQRPVMKAFMQAGEGIPVNQTCPACGFPITVEAVCAASPAPNVWLTNCSCGKCKSSFKGL